ncbi:hypothetical protein PPYR_06097 [Photinus pyralis]|nr:hypothetical protein PPYR_06097 [Photinus pyralis]
MHVETPSVKLADDHKGVMLEEKAAKAEDQKDIQKRDIIEEKVIHVETPSVKLEDDHKGVVLEEKTTKAKDQKEIQKRDIIEEKVMHVETPSVKLEDERKRDEKPTKSEDQGDIQSKVSEDVGQEKVVHVEATSMDEKPALEEKPAKEEKVKHVEASSVDGNLALEEKAALDEGGVQRKAVEEEIAKAEMMGMVKEKAEIEKQDEKTKVEGDLTVLEKEICEKTFTADIQKPTKSETEVVERKTSFSSSADMPISERLLEDPLTTKVTHADILSERLESQPPEHEDVISSNAELEKVKMSTDSDEIVSMEKVPHDEVISQHKESEDAAQLPECAGTIKSVTEELDKVKASVADSKPLAVEEKLTPKVDAVVSLETSSKDLEPVVDAFISTESKKITPPFSPDLKSTETALPHSDIISSPQFKEEKAEILPKSPRTSISDAKQESGKSSPIPVVEHAQIDDSDKLEMSKDTEVIVKDQPIISRTISPDIKLDRRDSTTKEKISLEHAHPSEGKPDKMSSDITKKEETSHETLEKKDTGDERVSQKLDHEDLPKVDTSGIGFVVDEKECKHDTVVPSDGSSPGLATDVSTEEKLEVVKPLQAEMTDKDKVEDKSLAHTSQEETEIMSEKGVKVESVLPISSEVSLTSQVAEAKHETEEVEDKGLTEQSTNEKSQIIGEKTSDVSTEIVLKESPEECAKLVKSSENLLQDLKSEIPAKLDERLAEDSSDRPTLEMEDFIIKGKSQTSSGKVSPEITVKEVLDGDKDKCPSGSGKSSPAIMLEGKEALVPVIDQRSDATYETSTSGRSSPEVVELTKDLLGTKQSPIISRKSTPEIIVDNEFVVLDRLSPDVDIIETEKMDAESGDKTIHITESVSEVPKSSVDSKDATQVPGVPEKVPTEDKEVIVSISQSSDSAEPSLSIVSEASTSAETKVEILDATKGKDVELSSGRTTPPTAPVSPILKEKLTYSHDKPVEKKETEVPVAKGVDIRSATPASDDCDISSGQVSRVLTTEEDDYKQVYSDDEEIPGSPLSATSQIAHSISSQYDFEDSVRGAVAMDPMSTSFYGALPDDPVAESASVIPHGSPSHIYEITTAKFANIHLQEELQKETKPDPKADIMTASFIGSELPSDSKEDPIASWGKPLGLPSPAPLNDNKGTPKKEKKVLTNVMFKNRINEDKKSKKVNPVYVDLTYVPHNGNSNYSYVDFFKRVRARYYVFSGIEPSKEVYSALLEAKQTWDDKDLEVTIIPTYDTDVLGYWVAENEDLLAKYKIDLSPSASRCTINLQDHETSCSAYRLEFS